MSLLAMRAKVHKVICTGHKYNKTMEHIKVMLYLLLGVLLFVRLRNHFVVLCFCCILFYFLNGGFDFCEGIALMT